MDGGAGTSRWGQNSSLSNKYIVLGLGAMMIGAFLLRAQYFDEGLGEIQNLNPAVSLWGDPGEPIDPNPHAFTSPSLGTYSQFAGQGIWYFTLSLAGRVVSLNDFREILTGDPAAVMRQARVVQSLIAVLIAVPVFVLGRAVGGAGAGWLAAALCLVLPIGMAQSFQVTPDLLCALFSTASLAAMTFIVRHGRRQDYLWSGFFLGLAASSQYTGVLLLFPLAAAHGLRVRQQGGGPIHMAASVGLWEALFLAALAFVMTSPFVVLDYGAFASDFQSERTRLSAGQLGLSGEPTWTHYAAAGFQRYWTWAAGLLAVGGVALSLFSKRHRGLLLPSVLFVLLFFTVIGSWRAAEDRFSLPLYPVVCVLAAVCVVFGASLIPGRTRVPVLVIVGSLLTGSAALDAVQAQDRWRSQDSRAATMDWIEQHVPPGSTILLEQYGPRPDSGKWNVLYLPFHATHPHIYDPAYSPVLYTTFDYVVLSSAMYDRYMRRPFEYPAQTSFYSDLTRGFEESKRFSAGIYSGPTVVVLKKRSDGTLSDLSEIPREFFDSLKGRTEIAEYFSKVGGALVVQGQGDLGYSLINHAVSIDDQSSEVWYNRGTMLLNEGNMEEALLSLRKSRDLSPEDPRPWYALASLQTQDGEFRQAANSYRKVIELDPSQEDAWIGLARVLVENVHYAEARLVLREFLSRFPRSSHRANVESALKELGSMGPGRP